MGLPTRIAKQSQLSGLAFGLWDLATEFRQFEDASRPVCGFVWSKFSGSFDVTLLFYMRYPHMWGERGGRRHKSRCGTRKRAPQRPKGVPRGIKSMPRGFT
jgi:hypothetical protein